METTIGIKIVGAVVLFAVTFLFTLLPHKLRKIQQQKLKGITSFCGGLFLGLCFLHLIPDTLSEFQSMAQLRNIQKLYPLAEFTIIIGMIFVMTAEKLANIIQHTKKNDDNKQCDGSENCCKEKCKKQGQIYAKKV